MKRQKRVAVINDVTGFGRCSAAVAQPIISAMRLRCCVVPTAILSVHTGFPTYFLCNDVFPSDVSVILMIGVMLPFFFITFYEKDGMPFEKYAKFIYQHKVYQSHERRKEVNLEETKTTGTKIGTTKEAAPKGQKGAKKRR